MKKTRYKNIKDIAQDLGLDPKQGELAELKAKLTDEVIKAIAKQGLTHQKVAELSQIPRSAITGIVSGSLQKITVDRLLRVLASLGKNISLNIDDKAA